jgi:hypothetical protein
MLNHQWRRELTIAVVAFAIGFFLLPIAVYWVGRQFIGEYAVDAGMLDLADQIWSDFLNLEPAAWLFVFSPYLTLQLSRLFRRIGRARNPVKPVTNPHPGR